MICRLMFSIRRKPSIIEFDAQGNRVVLAEIGSMHTWMVGDLGEGVNLDSPSQHTPRRNAIRDIELDTFATPSSGLA
jgi:hypothetical protein